MANIHKETVKPKCLRITVIESYKRPLTFRIYIKKNLGLLTVSFTLRVSLKMLVVSDGSENNNKVVSHEKLGNLRYTKASPQRRLTVKIKLFSI